MNETKNKNNKKRNNILLGVGLLSSCCCCMLLADCVKHSSIDTVVKAETPTQYIFELNPSSSPINLTWQGYSYDSIVYVNGIKYEGVSNLTVANSIGQVTISTQATTYTLDNTQDIALVVGQNVDGEDYPQYQNPGKWSSAKPYMPYNYEFITTPLLIDTFANQNYKGIPITSIAYNPGTYTIYTGLFYSNGHKYHSITLRLAQLNGTEWRVNNETIAFNTGSHSELRNLCYVANMKYDNDTVYQIDGTEIGGDYYLTSYYRWTNPNYQQIQFLCDYLSPNYPNYPTATFREMFDAYNFGRIIVVDDSLKNAFNVIALALTSILPVLNFKIASDITLGTLILVPITVCIIIAIIKLLRR